MANLIDLLRNAHDHVKSARLKISDWADPGRLQAAWSSVVAGSTGDVRDITGPEPYAVLSTCWVALPGGLREESHDWLAVQSGEAWWSKDAAGTVTQSPSSARPPIADIAVRWLGPADLLELLDVTETGSGTVAGRPTVEASAIVKPGLENDFRLSVLGWGADQIELSVDRERGTLLRTVSMFKGAPFRRTEALEASFDEAFDEALFDIPPRAAS
jgi:hypothetical protein